MTGRPDGGEPVALSLTNPRSDRIKMVRALSGRSARRRTGRFLVEGPQAVREAVRFAPQHVRDVYLSESAAQRYTEIVAESRHAGLFVHVGTAEVLDAISADAQGVVAVVDDPTHHGTDTALESLTEVLQRGPRLVAVLSHVRDPGNAGAVIRAADAAGAQAVVLIESSVELTNPKVVRSTAGSLFHLPVITGISLPDAVSALHQAGLQVLAADGQGETSLDSMSGADLAAPTGWIFGNEAWGLSPEERALADRVVRVPLFGHAESLNLATAATVCLYASAFAQRH